MQLIPESPASEGAIQELQKFSSIDVPLDYLEVLQHCTNAEINVKNEL
ncbi:SMI1/KNR4 family protein [Bacillus cereus]|nr:SMI1/KNR4 family protein [Bacillus cereus]MDM5239268.1 SMI1/KNR4 family protein [Bacillus cereus]